MRDHLTLEEKAGLLQGYGWSGYTQGEGHYSGNVRGVPRLGIPSINMQDAGQGFRTSPPDIIGTVTSFPSALAAAASWDRNLVHRYAATIGKEFKMKGANVVLGPAVNVHRVPRNGRNAEYLSGEDPYLGSVLTAEYVKGIQSEGVAACVKHFVLNNQETRREETSVEVEERPMFEVFYPPFAAAVAAGAASVMCSYNKVNGQYACGASRILNDHLRGVLGFRGFVMSDWWATHDSVASRNGVDQELPGTQHLFDRWKLENEDADIDAMARNVLTGMFSSGAWDNGPHCTPGQNCSFLLYQRDATSHEHDAVAREVGRNGGVLLKNEENVLPLHKGVKVALVGSACSADFVEPWQAWNAGDYYSIGGSGRVIAHESDRWDVERGLQDAKQSGEISELIVYRGDDVDDALEVASDADVMIACGGSSTTEGTDRDTLELAEHDFLVSLASKVAMDVRLPRLVVVALAPGSIVTRGWSEAANSVLLLFLSGQATGLAAADLLLGRVNPSGKLPVTLPLHEDDMLEPCWADTCKYDENLSVGWKGLIGRDVSYAFGHGLSYTQFRYAWENDQPTRVVASPGGELPSLTLRIIVTNVGNTSGSECAQLYLAYPATSGEPPLVLRGFEKTAVLQPGKADVLSFDLFARDLSVWDVRAGSWKRAPGTFKAHVGASSRDLRLEHSFVV